MRKLIHLQECVSTNDELSKLVKSEKDLIEYVIRSDFQTSGKGQKGAFWEAKMNENLTFSYNLVDIGLYAHNQFYISAIIALSLVELISEIIGEENVRIKWPNDIYIGTKKVAGILIENDVCGDKIQESLIGIGLNVNQQKFESDAPNPISMFNILHQKLNIEDLLNRYLDISNKYVDLLRCEEFESIKSEYLKLMYQINEKRTYIVKNKEVIASITGVDEYGFLQLKIDNQLYSYDIKEVVYL